MKLQILRLYQTPIENPKQTESIWYLMQNHRVIFECVGLELPWMENEKRVSCVIEGKYKGVKHVSPKFGNCIWIKDVPNRSEILIHAGNYVSNTLGCPLPGEKMIDINNDGLKDVTNSKKTLDKLLDLIEGDEIDVEILWRQ